MQNPQPPAPSRIAFTFLVVWVLAFVPSLNSRGPWEVDDARYVEVGREMAAIPSWWVPRLNGEVYSEKPPAYFWSVGTLTRLLGDHQLAARLLSAAVMAAVGLSLVVLARLAWRDAAAGWWAALVTITCVTVLDRGQRTVIDTFLLGTGTVTIVAALAAVAAPTRAGRGFALVTTAGALTAGILAKGPVGLLVPVVVLLAIAPAMGVRARALWPRFAVCALLAAGLGALWLWHATALAGPEYRDHLLFGRGLNQAEGETPHLKPWSFYLGRVPPGLLPWFLLLPTAVVGARVERREGRSQSMALLFAAAAILLLFSVFPGKRPGYVLGLYPLVGAAVGRAIATATRTQGVAALLRVPLRLLAGLALCLGAAIPAAPFLATRFPEHLGEAGRPVLEGLPAGTRLACGVGGMLLLALGVLAWRSANSRPGRSVVAVATAVGLVSALLHVTVIPAKDPLESPGALVARYEAERAPDEELVLFETDLAGMINYFTERTHRVVRAAELGDLLAEPGRTWLTTRRHQAVPQDALEHLELVLRNGAALLYRER